MLEDAASFVDPSLPTAALQQTGGSSGRQLTLHRSAAELEFIAELFLELQRGQALAAGAPCIAAMGSHHGQPTPVPYRGPVAHADFTLPVEPGALAALFAGDGSGRRDTVFVGLESQVRIATCRLIEAGFDFSLSRVGAIVTTGDFVTGRLRRWLEETWGAPLRSRYSLSEVFGGADRCAECGAYHCDPHLLPEVVDPAAATPIRRGTGVLVLTCLRPFVQKQPMIRYFTGDVVTVTATDCPVDPLGFELRGRLSSCVVVPTPSGPAALLAGHDLYDVLDEHPDVASSAMFPKVTGVADRSALGHVKACLDHRGDAGRHELVVTVELRYAHYLYAERAAALLAALRQAILDRSPLLAGEIAAGRASLTLRPALSGTLASFQPDEVE